MHVIEETDTFTLVGVDAKLGKLTLFDAEGPRTRGALERRGPAGGRRGRGGGPPAQTRRCAAAGRPACSRPRAGCRSSWSSRGGTDFDLDHVVLRLPDREAALRSSSGWASSAATTGRWPWPTARCASWRRRPADGERPLLNHIALLVDSAEEVRREAEERGVEVDDVKDAPNTFAVFLRGPAGVRIEYVEHKPGFALV